MNVICSITLGGDTVRRELRIEYISDFLPKVIPEMVYAGIKEMESAVKDELEKAIKNGTGGLVKSINASHAFIRDGGTRFKANVYFNGEDGNGVRQGLKAGVHNYGRRMEDSEHNWRTVQKGSGFKSKAERKARGKVEKAMEAELDKFLAEENVRKA